MWQVHGENQTVMSVRCSIVRDRPYRRKYGGNCRTEPDRNYADLSLALCVYRLPHLCRFASPTRPRNFSEKYSWRHWCRVLQNPGPTSMICDNLWLDFVGPRCHWYAIGSSCFTLQLGRDGGHEPLAIAKHLLI